MEVLDGGFQQASGLDVPDHDAVVNADRSFLLKLADELDLASPDFARENRASLKRDVGGRRDAVSLGEVNWGNKRSECNQEIRPIYSGCCRAIFHGHADGRELRVRAVGVEDPRAPVGCGSAVILGPSDDFAGAGRCSDGSQMERGRPERVDPTH
jgi:hypothetical protein